MKVLVDMEILEKFLPPDELAKITEGAKAARENHKEYMKKWRENHGSDCENHRKICENHGENHKENVNFTSPNVKITSSESGEICPKMPILPESSANFPMSRAGGERGGCMDLTYVHGSNNGTFLNNDAKSTSTLNSINQSKSENVFSKKSGKKEKWERIKKEFEPYWIAYPEEGRTCWKEALFIFNKIKADIPPPACFVGMVIHFVRNVWVGDCRTPSIKTFLEREEWAGLSEEVKSGIEQNKAACERNLAERQRHFKMKFRRAG